MELPASSGEQTKFNKENFEDILLYFLHSIHDKNEEEEILWDLASNCISKLGFLDCVVYVVDWKKKKLIQKAAFGPKNPKAREIYMPVSIDVGKGISGFVAESGIAEIIHDTSLDDRYIVDDERRFSEICVPVLYNDKVLGIIDCEHPDKGFFTSQHLRILTAIASVCGIKLDAIRKEKKAKEEQERSLRLQKEMVDVKIRAFRTQMNPHFIFNALSSIQYFITSEKKKPALEYLSAFSKLIRFYLKHIEKDTVWLTDEIAMLSWYLKLQELRYKNRFTYTIQAAGAQHTQEVLIPSFVLQTLLENIIENLVSNQLKDCELGILYAAEGRDVTLTISYLHEKNSTSMNQIPEYRARMIRWQDQIKLLNGLNGYSIKKNIVKLNKGTREGAVIELYLPKLS